MRSEDGFFGGHLHDGLVMAMSVDERAARQLGKGKFLARCSRNSLSRKTCFERACARSSLGKEVGEFVAEDGGTAWFEDDDGRAGFDFGESSSMI
jgi:hypothetical protein